MKKKVWMGSPPCRCDLCECKLGQSFVDGRTSAGPWAIMCTGCHGGQGGLLGVGLGQKYVLMGAQWVKVKG